jgi:hypothetical protein
MTGGADSIAAVYRQLREMPEARDYPTSSTVSDNNMTRRLGRSRVRFSGFTSIYVRWDFPRDLLVDRAIIPAAGRSLANGGLMINKRGLIAATVCVMAGAWIGRGPTASFGDETPPATTRPAPPNCSPDGPPPPPPGGPGAHHRHHRPPSAASG